MPTSNDAVFAKEFKDMMNGRRALSPGFNLVDIPVPQMETMITGIPRGKMALVRGVKEPFFERLNNREVQLIGRTTLQKRQVLSDGGFRKDSNGNYVTTQIPVPQDSVAIVSDFSIGLKRHITIDGVRREHKVSKGFRYVDYFNTKEGRRYIYIVPKRFVYRLSMCSLILTPNKRRVFFKGVKLALQNGSYVYLYVVPYRYRDNADARVLGVKSDFNFDAEVLNILGYWMRIGVVFDLNLTQLESQLNGTTNLGVVDLEGTIVSEDYRRYSVSLADEKDNDGLSDGWASADGDL